MQNLYNKGYKQMNVDTKYKILFIKSQNALDTRKLGFTSSQYHFILIINNIFESVDEHNAIQNFESDLNLLYY